MAEQIFKFLDRKNIDDMLVEGTIRVSTLSHFRKLEGSDWIANRNEATTIVNVNEPFVLSSSGSEHSEPWRPESTTGVLSVIRGGSITVNNMIFAYQHPDCFIFCASVGERETLTQAMCRDAVQPYDACIRIRVPFDQFVHRLFYRGVVLELNERVQKLFSKPRFQRVTYDAFERDYIEGQAPAPSAFRKHPKFAAQSEIRILLEPKQEIQTKQITIRLQHPERIFEEEFRTVPAIYSLPS
jgi:hypothetical protein